MTQVVNYRIKEYSKSTGTGDFVTTAAVANQRRFSSLCSTGDSVFYSIVDSTNSTWETGLGVYTAANTISRITVKNSSNANALVNFGAGTKTIEITPVASENEYHPTIKPTLNLDFVNSESLDPRVSFVRNTIATRWNSKGILETVAANVPRFDYDPSGTLVASNLLWYSSFAGTLGGAGTLPSNWITIGAESSTLSLSNTNPAFTTSQIVSLRKITVDAFNGVGLTTTYVPYIKLSQQYTISVYVRIPTGLTASDIYIYTQGGTPNSTLLASASTLNAQAKDTWVRYSSTITFTANGFTLSFLSITGAVGTGFDITAPQMNNGATAYPFVPTSGTAAEVWTSPLTKTGLLVENSRTNYFTNSTLVNLGYNPSSTVTANYGLAPDGTTTSLRVVTPTGNGYNFGQLGTALADVITTAVTHSVFIKPKGINGVIPIYVGDGTSTGGLQYYCTFANGVPVLNNSGIVQNVGNGWFRLIMPYTPSIANTSPNITILNNSGVSVDIEWWGAQREVGAYATSYIPTGASVVTRNTEDAKISGTEFNKFYNQSEGTIVATSVRYYNIYAGIVGLVGTTNGNDALHIYQNGATDFINQYISASPSYDTNLGTVSYGTPSIAAYSYSSTITHSGVSNGKAILNTATSAVAPGIATLWIGGDRFNGGNKLNAHIKSIKYYNKALPNNIQAMTA